MLTMKYYFRLEECTCNPLGDGKQFPLSGEDPDRTGLAEFRQIDCATMANPGRTLRRCHHGRGVGSPVLRTPLAAVDIDVAELRCRRAGD